MVMIMMRRSSVLSVLLILTTIAVSALHTHSFTVSSRSVNTNHRQNRLGVERSAFQPAKPFSFALHSTVPDPFDNGELASALVRLNTKWEIEQQQPRRARPESRWDRLDLTPTSTTEQDEDNTKNHDDNDENGQDGDNSSSSSSPPSSDFVYLCEPTGGTTPSMVIVFIGGAVIGQYPHIVYSELLTRVSDRLNAAVIASPYQVGLDHFGIAKAAGEKARRAIVQCQDEKAYPESIPTFCVAHSLGCKLSTIYNAATGMEYNGMAFLAFNNYGFAKTIGMAREFANEFRQNNVQDSKSGDGDSVDGNNNNNNDGMGMGMNEDLLETLFNFGEMAVSTMGIEFTPSPADTERLIELKVSEETQRKTRLFVFDNDRLDCSDQFAEIAPSVTTAGLKGSHLTPVFLRFGLDNLPEETRPFAEQATRGYKSAAFGDEDHLEALVDELCAFVFGKPPSRAASWATDRPLLSSNSGDGV